MWKKMWCMEKSYHVSYTFKKRTIEKPSLHVIRSKNLKKANRKSQGTDGWSIDFLVTPQRKMYIDDGRIIKYPQNGQPVNVSFYE